MVNDLQNLFSEMRKVDPEGYKRLRGNTNVDMVKLATEAAGFDYKDKTPIIRACLKQNLDILRRLENWGKVSDMELLETIVNDRISKYNANHEMLETMAKEDR